MATQTAPRHRGLFWFAVLLALGALVGGGIVAYVAYQETSGPDGAVRGYFAALARSDAPAALGFGSAPASGNRALLTSTVLREQHKIAPIRDVKIDSTHRTGNTATVGMRYQLGFANGTQNFSESIRVIRHKGSWRLAETAVTTELNLLQAADRATIVGAPVPSEPMLLFPGAVPIRFDTPYLMLAQDTNSVQLSSGKRTDLVVEVTEAGKTAINNAVAAALKTCLAGGAKADPRCPLPNARAVPGSLRATLSDRVDRKTQITVASDAHGVLDVSATLKVTGRYSVLNFDNLPVPKTGSLTVPISAKAFAVAPLVLTWQDAP
jgi:hypothetical protein